MIIQSIYYTTKKIVFYDTKFEVKASKIALRARVKNLISYKSNNQYKAI